MTNYETPTIIELGSVAELTGAQGGFRQFDRNGYFGGFLQRDVPRGGGSGGGGPLTS